MQADTKARPRIAVGGIHIECSTYNPVAVTAEKFRIRRGPALLAEERFKFLQGFEADFVPLMHARCIPGGRIERATYDQLKREFIAGLKAALPLDGVYLAMHGAACVEGMDDAEGDWITAAREAAGDACLLSASYDLHGNVSQTVIDGLDMFAAYRTAPHIDIEDTMRRSVAMLIHALASGEKPALLWVPVPVLLPGEKTSTEDEPARSLYRRLPEIDRIPGVWNASLMVGYVWADEPRVTAAAVLTGTDRPAMEKAALTLARAYWRAREEFCFGYPAGNIAAMVEQADRARSAPVILADSGDNPTGGGVGDRADLLRELLAQGIRGVVLAGITDAPAVQRCFDAGLHAWIDTSVGATLDPDGSRPVRIAGTVSKLLDSGPPGRRQAVVSLPGIELVLCSERRPYHNIREFLDLGLDPRKARIVVVKSGYLSPELAPLANPGLLVLSPGVVDQDVARLPRRRSPAPMFPFQTDFDFTPRLAYSGRSR